MKRNIVLETIDTIIGYDNLNLFGSICSIIALVISFIILVRVKKIKSLYRFKINTPDILSKLKKYYANLSKYLNNIDSSINDIKNEFSRASANLKSIKSNCPIELKKSISDLSRDINRFVNQTIIYKCYSWLYRKKQNDVILEIHNKFGAIIEEIDNSIKISGD